VLTARAGVVVIALLDIAPPTSRASGVSSSAALDRGPGEGLGVAPITALTPASHLPRARALTEALLESAADASTICDSDTSAPAAVAAVRQRLERGLRTVAGSDGRAALLRIGHFQIARCIGGVATGIARTDVRMPVSRPFRWTSRAARRPIGLAALRAGLDGRAASPADAVELVMREPGGPHGVGRAGPGSCADWIASVSPPARALVASEATAWTTRLWTAIEWDRLDPEMQVVGGSDRWWRWTDPSSTFRIALRGRADVRLGVRGDPGARDRRPSGAHLLVLDGLPGLATRHAILLSALVDLLSWRRRSGSAPPPARVIGWWPDSGRTWIVPVDARGLGTAADAVVSTARVLLEVPEEVPGKGDAQGRR
jgi:hypothetical protein